MICDIHVNNFLDYFHIDLKQFQRSFKGMLTMKCNILLHK